MYGFDLIWSKTYQCPKCSFTVVGQIPHCSKCGTWFKLSGAPKRHFQPDWPILITFGILAGLLGGLIAYRFASPWLFWIAAPISFPCLVKFVSWFMQGVFDGWSSD